MKTFHLGKATDLYDCGTATFGIAKGNIQSVLTLVIRDPGWGGGRGREREREREKGYQPYFLRSIPYKIGSNPLPYQEAPY